MIMRERNRNNKRTVRKQFDWFGKLRQTNVGLVGFSERNAKQSVAVLFFITYFSAFCMIGQWNNPLSILGILLARKREKDCFDFFSTTGGIVSKNCLFRHI